MKDLDLNRQRLLDRLQPAEYAYIEDNWRDKEERVIAVYTRKYLNLGANASQRAESFHTVMYQVTHGQLSLEDSVKRLAIKTAEIYTHLEEAEDRATIDQRTSLDLRRFETSAGTSLYWRYD